MTLHNRISDKKLQDTPISEFSGYIDIATTWLAHYAEDRKIENKGLPYSRTEIIGSFAIVQAAMRSGSLAQPADVIKAAAILVDVMPIMDVGFQHYVNTGPESLMKVYHGQTREDATRDLTLDLQKFRGKRDAIESFSASLVTVDKERDKSFAGRVAA